MVQSYQQRRGTLKEWLIENPSMALTTIITWQKEAKENGASEELQNAELLRQNMNDYIKPNVNEDKEETIRIMKDSNIQHSYNLCTIIEFDLPTGGKKQIMVMKSNLISSLVEEKMSQPNSNYTPLLEACMNEPCTRIDCKCCTQMEHEANVARDTYFLELENLADDENVVAFEDHDLDDKYFLFDIQQTKQYQEKKKIYNYLMPIHPFYMNPDAQTETLYLGNSAKERRCASRVGPHGIHGKYGKDGADDMVQMFEATKEQMNTNAHSLLYWRNDDHPTQLEEVDASMIERENEDDHDMDIQDSDWKATSNTTNTTINLTDDSVEQSISGVSDETTKGSDTTDYSVVQRRSQRRRVKKTISYAEPALNTKLRQGMIFFPSDKISAKEEEEIRTRGNNDVDVDVDVHDTAPKVTTFRVYHDETVNPYSIGNERLQQASKKTGDDVNNGLRKRRLSINFSLKYPLPNYGTVHNKSNKMFGISRIIRSTVEPFEIPFGNMDHISQHQFNGDNNLDNTQKSENSSRYYIINGFPHLVNPHQVDYCLDDVDIRSRRNW